MDRLTRSRADFAQLVELLDAQGVSFVSVTQSFNTTTSMGRLTLNVLLSFAQFEREVTGERIRDKIAASKKKGIWIGGVVPLGYELQDCTRLRSGFCVINGDVWQDDASFRPTHERPIGYLFQEASLFPHLSVRRNLLYGARKAGRNGQPSDILFDEVIDLLGLAQLLDRAPHNLSGGERQRVAIGRALLSQPKLLLMDEPISALDKSTKDEIPPFLERLHETLFPPVIYVSHDMIEIERLADHLVLMEAGRIIASGPLTTLQSDPNLPLLKTPSAAVSLDAVTEYGLATLSVPGGQLLIPSTRVTVGELRRVRVVASDVSLALELAPRSTIINVLPARILEAASWGEHEITAVLGLGPEGNGAHLLARVTLRSWDLLGLQKGMNVYAQVKASPLCPDEPAKLAYGG